MEEDELQALTLTLTATPSTDQTLTPPPPPIAPIPPPPPSAAALLLRSRSAAAPATPSSDSDRESSLPLPSSNADDYEISEESRLARERQEKAVQELLLKRRAFAMAVPTNDSAVRARLRRLGEPITLFGEREMERRDRLRSIMVRLETEGQLEKLLKVHDDEQAAEKEEDGEEGDGGIQVVYPFYTEGSKELLDVRVKIARYSIKRAKARVERARRRRNDPDEDEEGEAREAVRVAGEFVLECSEIGDDRPLSGCSFSHDGLLLATRYCSFLCFLPVKQ